jgi:hypothetical protein
MRSVYAGGTDMLNGQRSFAFPRHVDLAGVFWTVTDLWKHSVLDHPAQTPSCGPVGQVVRETGSGGDLFSASRAIRDGGSLKPAWFAYATLIRELDGVKTGPKTRFTSNVPAGEYALTVSGRPGA